ncbi:3-hydroxybutyrate oligomer hydrolase family protein [Saccharomonospora xinjiangensis]|uniref:3-hydroxybutyrate oligomer hydrolase family protein n=1 Tax=Saccharomonospora xinjiangensis TaxID=75294 RepID=UPI00106F1229|nr:3-hydroxybutyrate oligomer hydrolase family protein [Saccharomonospora xinjiangensis]QBQ61856.1 D-(-)-3-hydroxybutyrate oligomer hydrolase [Saccharomonospora xinjiangensis]
MSKRTIATALLSSLLVGASLASPAALAEVQPGSDGQCAQRHLRVPGARHQQVACLDDLTTTGTVRTGHTDPADWAGLTQRALPVPGPVPGIQIDGYFPDTSTTNTNHGWNHDSQFVIRLPRNWNGGLVVSGAPGNREQYANDRVISDWVLSKGYAFAATDKGNTGLGFHTDGRRPGDAVAEWNHRVTQLTRAAKATVTQHYRRPPSRTVATGLSNGGYLVRWQLENHPELYEGGVDWEGTLWSEEGPNLVEYLPKALSAYPRYADGGADADAAHAELVAAGFGEGSEFLWPYHYEIYWDLTQRIYREEIDPEFDGDVVAGIPFCEPGTPACDADYDYRARPAEVHEAVERIGLTGRIGKPLLTLHGTLDVLLPISESSDVYAEMVREQGRGHLHRYYRIADGTHTDSLVDSYPGRLRALTSCHRTAFEALEAFLADGTPPPASATIPRPTDATPEDLVTTCDLG